jgi:hypothetical protein
MIDELIPQIEEISAQGAIVLLRWDGERKQRRVIIFEPSLSIKQSATSEIPPLAGAPHVEG